MEVMELGLSHSVISHLIQTHRLGPDRKGFKGFGLEGIQKGARADAHGDVGVVVRSGAGSDKAVHVVDRELADRRTIQPWGKGLIRALFRREGSHRLDDPQLEAAPILRGLDRDAHGAEVPMGQVVQPRGHAPPVQGGFGSHHLPHRLGDRLHYVARHKPLQDRDVGGVVLVEGKALGIVPQQAGVEGLGTLHGGRIGLKKDVDRDQRHGTGSTETSIMKVHSGGGYPSNGMPESKAPPRLFLVLTSGVWLNWWALAALRHGLLRSNAFDLGIYDQVAWQIAQGLEPRSTLLGLSHMGNHGAWAFLPMGLLYRIHPSVQWLLMLQSLCLAATAIPLWRLAALRGLPERLCWFVAAAWWLQATVFHTNLYDFHPETLAMPLLAHSFVLESQNRWRVWLVGWVLLLGFRDGLALIAIGIGLGELLRRRWRWAWGALGIGMGWLFFLSEVLYPRLNEGAGPAALERFTAFGDSPAAILWTLLRTPWRVLEVVHLPDIGTYLLLLALPLAWSWRKRSLPVLVACLPLLAANALSESEAQRNLQFHYQLPLAVLLVVATIEGLAADPTLRQWVRGWIWLPLLWLLVLWFRLVDPGDLLENFSERRPLSGPAVEVVQDIGAGERVIAPTYLSPHLTHRQDIRMPKTRFQPEEMAGIQRLVLHLHEPGWASSGEWNRGAIAWMKQEGWSCKSYATGFLSCRPGP